MLCKSYSDVTCSKMFRYIKATSYTLSFFWVLPDRLSKKKTTKWAISWDYVLFVLCKLILQTRMRSHPVGLDIWFFVRHFVYFHTSCVQTVMALARLRRCAGSPEPSLVAYVISTIISWAGSNFIMFGVIGLLLALAFSWKILH